MNDLTTIHDRLLAAASNLCALESELYDRDTLRVGVSLRWRLRHADRRRKHHALRCAAALGEYAVTLPSHRIRSYPTNDDDLRELIALARREFEALLSEVESARKVPA